MVKTFDEWGGFYGNKSLVTENDAGQLYNAEYFHELRDFIIKGEDIDKFLAERNERLHQKYITEVIEPIRQKQEKLQQNIYTEQQKIDKITNINTKIDEFSEDMQSVAAAYPPERREQVISLMKKYAEKGEFSTRDTEILQQAPKGFINRLKTGRKIKNANKVLESFIQKYKQHNIPQEINNLTENGVTYQRGQDELKYKLLAVAREDSASAEQNSHDFIEQKQKLLEHIDYLKNDIASNNKLMESMEQSYQTSHLRTKENDIIHNFVEQKSEILRNSPQMSPEQIKTNGLSETFIEGQILQSAYPEKVMRSIRGSYEGLDRPAAPMVAYSGNSESIFENLKSKGLDVVFNTDERAKDPNVFVIDKDDKAIYAPFLAPDEALKANLMMIDAVYEAGGETARSNPRTRETLVIATDMNLADETRLVDYLSKSTLDLEKMTAHYPNSRYMEITTEFAQDYLQGGYSNLDKLLTQTEKQNPELAQTLTAEMRAIATPYIQSGDKSYNENIDRLSNEFMQKHQSELMPFARKMYQNEMVNEAFSNGISSIQFNAPNVASLKENGTLKSVFHAGQNGNMPYSILAQDKRMCFTYSSSCMTSGRDFSSIDGHDYLPDGCLGYAFGRSSHNGKSWNTEKPFGIVYEYESRGDKQEFVYNESFGGVEIAPYQNGKFNKERINGSGDETAIFPHQNKLKAIYIAVEGEKSERRVMRLEVDDNGQVKDKRWREFLELHNPVDDNLKGNMIERRNNTIKQFDENGADAMWRSISDLGKESEHQNTTTKQEAEKPAQQDKTKENSAPKQEKTATTPSKDDKARMAELSGRTGPAKPTAKAQDDAAKTQDTPTKTQDGKAEIRPDAELKFATPMQTSDLPPAPVVVQAPSQDEYDKFASQNADSKLRKLCEDLRGKDEKLYTQVVTEWNRQYYENPPKDIEQGDNIAKNVMMQYKKDLEPLVVDQIQKDITPQNTANVDATKLDQAKDDLQQKDPTARAEAVAELNKHAENPVNITDAPQQTAFKEQTSQQQGEKVNAMRHGHNLDLEKSANYVPNTMTAPTRTAPQPQQTNTAAFNLAQATKTADTGRGSY